MLEWCDRAGKLGPHLPAQEKFPVLAPATCLSHLSPVLPLVDGVVELYLVLQQRGMETGPSLVA